MKHRNNKYFIVSMISLLIGVLPAISWPKSAGASYPIATVTNDDFNNAIVASSSYSNTQSISGATTAIDDPQLSCIFATGYYSIWYKYIPAQNGTLELDTFGSDYDTAMAVWTGSQGSLNEVGCDDDGNPDLTSLISINVTAGTAYYIEVVSYFNSLSGTNLTLSVSQVSGGMPGAFSKSSPSNGESGLDANPTLSWESSSGATSYEYCFDTNNNNTCDTSWVTSGTNTSKSLSGLSLGTTYYWQARAHNNTGTTLANSGSWWSFTTSSTLPDTSWNGTTNYGKTMSFKVNNEGTQWSDFSVTAAYFSSKCYSVSGEITITTSGPGTIQSGQFSSSGSTFSFTGSLSSATSASGTYSITNYTIVVPLMNPPYVCIDHFTQNGTWSATAPLPPPGSFGKSQPSNGAVGQASNPILSWDNSVNAAGYEICYDRVNNNSCDSSWQSTGTNTNLALNGLNGGTTYYWQVRASNSEATTYADNGSWWSFTVSLFSDIPSGYWAAEWIDRLYHAGITGGCSTSPLSYCPENSVTRAQMAVFLLKGIHSSGFTPPAVGTDTNFTDVATDHWAAAWIKQLAAEGITGGCGTGIYCPEDSVTRAQMAVFLLKAKHGSGYTPPAVGASTGFTDVATDYWAAAWVKQLAAEAITGGCGTGIYCPESSVTRAQMAVFLVKAFNLP